MYCPNCNKEYEGKFCPECGTKLIASSIGMSDCHNVNNEDNSVHISNKPDIELLQEKKILYLNECKRAYEDNVLDQAEAIALEEYRIKIGLDESTADSILESVRIKTERNDKKTSLNPIAKVKLKFLTDNLKKNKVNALMDQIDSLEALVNKFEHEELLHKCFLALAALKPEKCISLNEESKIDSYWKSFWSCLAYIKVGRSSKAEDTLVSLDRFADYPEDNMTVLAAAGALMKGKNDEANEYLDSLTGDYTPALQRLVDSIYLLLEPKTAEEMGADADACAFYLANVFGQKIAGKGLTGWDFDVIDEILKETDGYCLFDIDGNLLNKEGYYDVNNFYEGYAQVKKDEKWGFIDKSGREVIPCIYDKVGDFHESYAWVRENDDNWLLGKWGFIDKSGREVIPCIYDVVGDFYEGYAWVSKNGEWGYIDKSGRDVIPCNNFVSDFHEGYASVEKYKKWGFMDKSGREVISCIYDCVGDFHEGYAKVEKNEKWGYIDKSGRKVIPCIYNDVGDFYEGYARVSKNGEWGYIDRSGREVIPCIYDSVDNFHEGYASVEKDNRWGFMDKYGREMIPCIYDTVGDFHEGYAPVEKEGKWGVIDESGREVIPCRFEERIIVDKDVIFMHH